MNYNTKRYLIHNFIKSKSSSIFLLEDTPEKVYVESKPNFEFMKVYLEPSEASSEAPLGPLLSQLQIPMSEFCSDINFVTSTFFEIDQIYLKIKLIKYFGGNYICNISFPKITFFFRQFMFDYGFNLDDINYSYFYIFLEDLWFIIQMHSCIFNFSYFNSSKIIFGYLFSSNILIKYLFIFLKIFIFFVLGFFIFFYINVN